MILQSRDLLASMPDCWSGGCRGSNLRIQGVAYNSKLASQDAHQQWRAATEQSLTAAQLAVQLRALDAAILWDALKTPGSLGDSKWGRAELLSKRRDPSGRSWEYQLHIRPLNPPPVAAEGLGSSAETAKVQAFSCTSKMLLLQCFYWHVVNGWLKPRRYVLHRHLLHSTAPKLDI